MSFVGFVAAGIFIILAFARLAGVQASVRIGKHGCRGSDDYIHAGPVFVESGVAETLTELSIVLESRLSNLERMHKYMRRVNDNGLWK